MANGWSVERRARQAMLIRTWTPWKSSTGPQTRDGKARSSQNAVLHGAYSQEARRLAALLREYRAALKAIKDSG